MITWTGTLIAAVASMLIITRRSNSNAIRLMVLVLFVLGLAMALVGLLSE